jgi:hypothetical protein
MRRAVAHHRITDRITEVVGSFRCTAADGKMPAKLSSMDYSRSPWGRAVALSRQERLLSAGSRR